MPISVLVVIILVLGAAVIFWLIQSRGNTAGKHIDTTVTALGAVTEAVEEAVEAIAHKVEEVRTPPPPAADPAPAPVEEAAPAPAKAPAKAKAAPKVEKPAAKPATAEKAPKAPAEKPAKPAAEKKPAKAAAEPDNLRQIKGVGPKLATLLDELGITRFDQIAAWKPADIEKIDDQLGTFKGRPARDNWVEQAGYLAKGDIAGFEAKFGKLDG